MVFGFTRCLQKEIQIRLSVLGRFGGRVFFTVPLVYRLRFTVYVAANKSPYEKSADIRCDIRGFFKYADYRLNFPFLHLAAA